MKKVLLLGGNFVQQTATLTAKRLGYYVISVDYLPSNPAHKYADEYHNISTLDKDGIYKLAKDKRINGIVSYASDVSAPTAAYVAEKMGLPTNPYESVMVMTHKDIFRKFMKENHFPMPEGESFTDYKEAEKYLECVRFPLIIKPVDSSGSKGVTRIDSQTEFPMAWKEAIKYSISKRIIVEEYIEKSGYQIDGDIFVIDGKIRFWGICDQHHDFSCAPHTPIGLSYPPTQDISIQNRARALIERILSLLNMTIGAYNVEYIVGKDNEVYILEIGPRNGGNMITDVIYAATGVNLAEYTIKQAVGEDVSDVQQTDQIKCACSYILHSQQDGFFSGLSISDAIKRNILFTGLTIKRGDRVEKFTNASFGIGMMILHFDRADEMCATLDHMNKYVHINVTHTPAWEDLIYMNAYNACLPCPWGGYGRLRKNYLHARRRIMLCA